jgi:hypothetical protein
MALAILRLDDTEDPSPGAGHSLVVDTGTSTQYRIHLGKEVRREEGFVLLDGPYWSSPLQVNPQAGRHLDTRTRFSLDTALVTEPGSLAQLETVRAPDGRGPAWSRPVRLPGYRPARPSRELTMTLSAWPAATPAPARPRMAPLRSAKDTFSRPASIADLIGTIVAQAAPIVTDLINKTSATSATDHSTASLFDNLLRSILGAMAQHTAAAPAATPAPASPAPVPATANPSAAPVAAGAPATSPPLPASAAVAVGAAPPTTARPASAEVHQINRFVPYARTMIFGLDDALIGALAGPVLSKLIGPIVSSLPQLLNAANQQKLARQALTDKQIADLLSEVDRTTLMQQLLFSQNMPVNPGVTSSDLDALGALLQAGASVPSPAGTPAALARSASLDPGPAAVGPTAIASKALLTMVTGPSITRLGAPRVVFAAEQVPTWRFRLDAGAMPPTTPLPRAILQICVREPGGAADLLQRTERLTGLTQGSEIKVALSANEFNALPADTDLEVLACLRWRASRGTYQATCSQTVVVASRVQVRDRGDLVGTPVELTDMNRFRSFWNKVWTSVGSGADEAADRLWGLDVAMRYSALITTGGKGNGLMQARLKERPGDDGLRATTRGMLKSGIEIDAAELNKLLPMWSGEQPLSADDLAAFAAPGWRAGQGGDAVTDVRMEGKRGTHGALWVVPVLKLRAFTLATPSDIDPYGQLTATQDRPVRFPVVESVRVLGLSSLRDTGEQGDSADVGTSDALAAYRFEGYDVILNQLVGLDPAQPLPRAKR